MASEVSVSPSSVMEPIPPTKPSSETSLCDVSYEGEFLGGTTTTAPDTPLSTTATYLFRRASRGSSFRPSRLRTRTEDTVPSKGTSYRRLLSGCSYSSVLPIMSTHSHNSFRAIVGDAQTTPYTMTEDNPFDSSKEMTIASAISSLSNDSAHRFQSRTEVSMDDKKPPPAEIFVVTTQESSIEVIKAKEDDWKQRWADGTDQTEDETDAPFDEIIEEKKTKKTFSKPPPSPQIPSLRPGTPIQKRPRAVQHQSAEKLTTRPLPLQRIKSAPDVSNGGARMPVTNPTTARITTTTQQHSPSLHRVNTDTTVTTSTANTANSGRPAVLQRSTTLPAAPAEPMLGGRPRRKDQKLPASETVFSFGSRVGQSSMMTPTSATTTTGPMSDLSPRIMIPRSQLSRRKKNGVQQDIEFLWKKVASPVRRWAGSDDKVNLRRSKTGCLA